VVTKTTAEPGFRFYGGKGGVGKTTLAAAAAVKAARAGRRVLILSTDPAHSLADALDVKLGDKPRQVAVPGRGRLEAAELDADGALERWLAPRRDLLQEIAERGTYFDEEDVRKFFDLSLPGVDELVGLVEIDRLAREGRWDEVVIDTAPTGHTLRLLAMPDTLRRIAVVLDDMLAKHRLLGEALGGRYRPDATDELIAELDATGASLAEALRDRGRTEIRWVCVPEEVAVAETEAAVRALDAEGLAVVELIVNQVTPAPDRACPACETRRRAEEALLPRLRALAGARTLRLVHTLPVEPRGVDELARLDGSRPPALAAVETMPAWPSAPLRARPELRLLIFGGKGGVGKTTCAAAAALEIAEGAPGRKVLLLSVDPAHSLGDVLGLELGDDERAVPGGPAGLRVRELDAARAFAAQRERYHASVNELFDALRGDSRFDATLDRKVTEDLIDLAPPGLDELFAMLAVVDVLVDRKTHDLVVLDTAPTGHTLRLLALPRAARDWVKALLGLLLKYRTAVGLGRLSEDLVALSRSLRELEALLVDPARTRFVAVTRAGELPRRETERLLDALGELHVHVPAIVVNAAASPGCTRCTRRASDEMRMARALERRCGCAILLAPASFPPPRGPAALRSWGRRWTHAWASASPTSTVSSKAAARRR
jgi:arsenite/tail-anchored protein-transporting ATPase